MDYIYEMNLARLRVSYLLPEHLHCIEIRTVLDNANPYDGSNITMHYWCAVRSDWKFKENGEVDNCDVWKVFEAHSLPALVELVRKWCIEEKVNQQSPV